VISIEDWRENAGGHEDSLDRFLAACAASQGRCGFGGADPEAAFDSLLARLDRESVPSSDPDDPRTLSGDNVRFVFEIALLDRNSWPWLAVGLSQAEAGDGSTFLSFFDSFDGTEDAARDDFQTAVLAVDQKYRRGPIHDYFALADRSYDEFNRFWYLSGYWDLVHALWQVEDRDAFRGRIRNPVTAAPILLIGMTHDPATPYVQAQRLAADLGNARLLTFDADGHGAVSTFDPCVLGALVEYLNEGILPPKDSVCVQQGEPFPSPGLRATERPEWKPAEPAVPQTALRSPPQAAVSRRPAP